MTIQCSLCDAFCKSTIEADKLGWDWFCGYLPERFVACPDCLKNRTLDVIQMREKSKVKVDIPSKGRGRPKHRPAPRLIILP